MTMQSTASQTTLNIDWNKLDEVGMTDGVGRPKAPIGDWRVRIESAEIMPNAAQTANNLEIEYRLLQRTDGSKTELDGVFVGLRSYYAGSPQSGDFMFKKLHTLLTALGISRTAGSVLSLSQLVGRTLDVTVIHELSKPALDTATGAGKQYVNDRVVNERAVGAARTVADPAVLSAEARRYENGEAPAGAVWATPPAATPPWAAVGAAPPAALGAAAGGATHTPPAAAAGVAAAGAATGGMPDEDRGPVAAARAHVVMNTPAAAEARKNLVDAGYPVEGPIDVADVDREDAALGQQYRAFLAAQQAGANKPAKRGMRRTAGAQA